MDPEVVITPYRDGPLLVRGPVRLVDQNGRPIDADRDPVALCRCGRSRIRPLCDGSHKQVGFRAPSSAETDRYAEAFEVDPSPSPPSDNGFNGHRAGI